MNATPLSVFELCAAASLVVASGLFGVLARWGIGGRLLVASARMIVQLLLAAIVLNSIFADASAFTSAAVFAFICLVAVAEVATKTARPLRPLGVHVAAASTVLTGALLASLLMVVLVQPAQWYAPRVVIPILGMLLGQAASGSAIALELMAVDVVRERAVIETRLALGAPKHVAFQTVLTRALRAGTMPAVMLLTTAGFVSMPGLMSAQILTGVDPIEAAKYQILLMLLIAGSSTVSVLATSLAAMRYLSDERGRVRLDRIGRSVDGESAAADWAAALSEFVTRTRRRFDGRR